ncbi:MAG: O-antigen ligase family protein [bacterium]
MIQKHGINPILAAVGIAILCIGLLYAFTIFGFDWRWLIVLGIVILVFGFVQIVEEKELFLMGILVFLIPFKVGFIYTWTISNDLIFAFDCFLFLLIGLWFFRTHGFRTGNVYLGKASIPAFIHVFWCLLSISMAVALRPSIFANFMLIKAVLLYFYIINNCTTKRHLIVIINMLMISCAIQGALGILQKYLGHPLGLEFLGERQVSYGYMLSRVTGTLTYPNQYGAFMILLLPMSMSLYLYAKERIKKLFYAAVTGIGLLGLFFSLSRSAWIAMIGAVIAIVILLSKRRELGPRLFFAILAIMSVIVFIGIIFGDYIALRFGTGEAGEYRFLMIRIAIPIILSHPIFGVGLFNYEYYSFPIFRFWHPVHNEYLRLAAEIGLPGLFFFLWFVFIVVRDAYSGLQFKDRYLNAVALGLIGSYIAFGIVVTFGPMYQHYPQKTVFWLLAGLAVSLKRIRRFELIKLQRRKALYRVQNSA